MINLEEWQFRDGRYHRLVPSTDILLDSDLRAAVYNWLWANGIRGALEGVMMGIDVWSIPDEQQRIWFILRWS